MQKCDPPEEIMVPRWDVPEGVSPALVNYIDKKGISGRGWTAISSAALSLAVKGIIIIEDQDGETQLQRVPDLHDLRRSTNW